MDYNCFFLSPVQRESCCWFPKRKLRFVPSTMVHLPLLQFLDLKDNFCLWFEKNLHIFERWNGCWRCFQQKSRVLLNVNKIQKYNLVDLFPSLDRNQLEREAQKNHFLQYLCEFLRCKRHRLMQIGCLASSEKKVAQQDPKQKLHWFFLELVCLWFLRYVPDKEYFIRYF